MSDHDLANVPARIRRAMARTLRSLVVRWRSTLVAAAVIGTALYVVAYPFFLTRYPPITDLPFHASASSILRHYFDPAYHFREQFELHFFDVPYASMYVLCAFLAFFM